MLKQCLLVLLAAGLISVAVPFAAAQSSNDSPPNNPHPRRTTVAGTTVHPTPSSAPRN